MYVHMYMSLLFIIFVSTYVCTYSTYVRMSLLFMQYYYICVSVFRLRVRLKAMQEVIDSQNERLADLQVSSQESLVREDTSTGQCK